MSAAWPTLIAVLGTLVGGMLGHLYGRAAHRPGRRYAAKLGAETPGLLVSIGMTTSLARLSAG